MDAVSLSSDSRAQLTEAHEASRRWLASERHLELKHPGARPRSTAGRFSYLGYRVSRSSIWPPRAILERIRQRISELVLSGGVERTECSVVSYRGVVRFGEPM